MGPFILIGNTCHKNKWAQSFLLAAPATKRKCAYSNVLALSAKNKSGPIHFYWQHLP